VYSYTLPEGLGWAMLALCSLFIVLLFLYYKGYKTTSYSNKFATIHSFSDHFKIITSSIIDIASVLIAIVIFKDY